MTITINLQPETGRGLLARAQAKGVSLADFAEEVLAREAEIDPPTQSPASNAKNLYDLFAPVRGFLPMKKLINISRGALLLAVRSILNERLSGLYQRGAFFVLSSS